MAMTPAMLAPPVRRTSLSWSRGRLLDLASATVAATIGAVSKPGVGFEDVSQAAYSVVVLGCCAAVLLRRSRPRASVASIIVLLVIHLALVDQVSVFAGVMCTVVTYTAQTRLFRPWRWVATAVACLGVVAAVQTARVPLQNGDWRARLAAGAITLGTLTIAALIGVVRRDARARYELAVERAAMLEREQEAERRLAAAEERTRIAQEMHDILGHSLNTVAMQAEGARCVLVSDPERAGQALEHIGRLSRDAVDEVRDLIDVLRSDDDTDLRPAPSLGDIPRLISASANAARTRLSIAGDPDAVPKPVSFVAYRIVQESLTNVIKHAGPVSTQVFVTVGVGSVDLVIVNDAPEIPAGAGDPQEVRGIHSKGGRHGIAGMSERIRVLGGTLDAGPDLSIGGWRVTAWLPWEQR